MTNLTTLLEVEPPPLPAPAHVMTVMACVPGQPMLTLVPGEELAARRDLRVAP